jgi:glycosyltransferase involved in cell wall biosynthesis
MRLLLVHNHYQQPGGEDQVFAAEGELLQSRGHEVHRYTAHNDSVPRVDRVTLARNTIWNQTAYRELRGTLRQLRPDLVHVHNTLPLLSPAVCHAAKDEGLPVVHTLHNYRLFCPNALFFRDGHVCEDCLGKVIPVPGVIHACYRGSRAASGTVAAMLAAHRMLGTWMRKVDVFIALTEFARQKFIAGGLLAEQVVVKPNFVPDRGVRQQAGANALFVGRLSPEKGIEALLAAWKLLGGTIPLKIIGDGPLREKVRAAGRQVPGVEWVGSLPSDQVVAAMKDALCLVVPSLWYETFGLVIAEAYSVGLPVIASKLGAMASMVEDGQTGLHFQPGDSRDLAGKIQWAVMHRSELAQMGRRARERYEAEYTAERNYQMLMDAYGLALERAREQPRAGRLGWAWMRGPAAHSRGRG